jgi:hypothetical protein
VGWVEDYEDVILNKIRDLIRARAATDKRGLTDDHINVELSDANQELVPNITVLLPKMDPQDQPQDGHLNVLSVPIEVEVAADTLEDATQLLKDHRSTVIDAIRNDPTLGQVAGVTSAGLLGYDYPEKGRAADRWVQLYLFRVRFLTNP